MKNTIKLSTATLYVSLLAFISFVLYILYINQEVFYTAHDRSEFLFGSTYFHTLMSKPFGLIQYIGAWLTQYFAYPALGTGILIVIWALIFFIGAKAFKLKGGASTAMFLPIACLLTSLVDLGYWIYLFPANGYWFSQSVGYLIMLILLWAAVNTSRKWHIAWYLVAFFMYPILGWFSLLFLLCLALSDKITWRELVAIVVLVFTASIWHSQCYSYLKFDSVVLAGFPRFIAPVDRNDNLSIPFVLLGAVSVIIPLCSRYLEKSYFPVLSVVAVIALTSYLKYQDKNYIDEMRMIRCAETDNWKGILDIVSNNPKPTSTMIMLKNVALMNEGGLLDRSFKMGNISNPINKPDSLHVTLLEIAAPIVYYNYGMMNEGVRLCFENSIQEGFSPFELKILSRCELGNNNKKLVDRYTSLLHHHPFYKTWQPSPLSSRVKALQNSYSDDISGVENSDSYIVNHISLWFDANNKLASEQALFYSMIRCDSRRFWEALRNYVKFHMNEEFPVHAQEAYILYFDKAPGKKRMMMPVEQSVYDRYKEFWNTIETKAKSGAKMEDVAKQMHAEWGGTYWYYNIFGRQVY